MVLDPRQREYIYIFPWPWLDRSVDLSVSISGLRNQDLSRHVFPDSSIVNVNIGVLGNDRTDRSECLYIRSDRNESLSYVYVSRRGDPVYYTPVPFC